MWISYLKPLWIIKGLTFFFSFAKPLKILSKDSRFAKMSNRRDCSTFWVTFAFAFYFCVTSLLPPREKGSMGREKGIMGRLRSCSHRLFLLDRFLEHSWQTAKIYYRRLRTVYICCYKLSVPFETFFYLISVVRWR